ncbi:cytochrome o ubiquinol oxidase subunit IV [Paraburkholderia sp. LEh10]|jgi:cytochrome o ubiquinol oxidase operon protein cyoD|uniref:cytochrome o ubiquinol oxidase subunit IV n=1 Tax=Paraburkholderia sp. LEh10 TaxID=2821353 RepID=UPI001AE4E152|nr:cytochrome o ubiquinol oxidase subunit IV [Paraburkholderia sp. LEh10]MBP0588615.1 cytochrome o ubiquinol oxidase subunit IV [Paraburkholderia sp. LEh10]
MSKPSQSNVTHAHAHHASHGSVKSYVIGMLLSLVLTFASFGVVMAHLVPKSMGLTAVVVLCVVQLLVQLRYFLHLGSSADQRANTGIFICTALLIVIIIAGSLWVIHNANVNMMPTQISVERALARD